MLGWLSKLLGAGDTAKQARPWLSWREGSFPTAAVGESNYQSALEALSGGHNRNGHELECEAELVPEPQNVYDANAVQVMISGRLVGYLCRVDAARFHEQMSEAGRPGEGARCAARINGGWRTNQYDEGSFGVRLGLPQRGPFTLT